MIVPSHVLLAKRIAAYLKKHYDIQLSRGAFERGSIAPDLFAKDKGSHRAELCLPTVERILAQIDPGDNPVVFSYKLGLAVHFTADYFTFAHNSEEMMRNLNRHFRYEMRLHYHLMRAEETHTLPLFTSAELIPMLAARHKLYAAQESCCENDLQCITEICTQLAAAVVYEYVMAAPTKLRVVAA